MNKAVELLAKLPQNASQAVKLLSKFPQKPSVAVLFADLALQGMGEFGLKCCDLTGSIVHPVLMIPFKSKKELLSKRQVGALVIGAAYSFALYNILVDPPVLNIGNNRGAGIPVGSDTISEISVRYDKPVSGFIPLMLSVPSMAKPMVSVTYLGSSSNVSDTYNVSFSIGVPIGNLGSVGHHGEVSFDKSLGSKQSSHGDSLSKKTHRNALTVNVLHSTAPIVTAAKKSNPLKVPTVKRMVHKSKKSAFRPGGYVKKSSLAKKSAVSISPVRYPVIHRPPVGRNINGVPSNFLTTEIVNEKRGSDPLNSDELRHLSQLVNYTGQTPWFDAIYGMTPGMQRKLYALAIDFNKLTGERINLKSAYRAKNLQASLFRSMPSGMAAGECGSPHSIGAVDIDREGKSSRQVSIMVKKGLLNKHGLWIPPEVREAWHVEDPYSVYFRFQKKGSKLRKIYSKNVCKNIIGIDHHDMRINTGLFTMDSTYWYVKKAVIAHPSVRKLSASDRLLIVDYVMFALRAESVYGRHLVSKTGAFGLFQFTQATGKQYGITHFMDYDQQIDAMVRFTLDNLRSLRKAKYVANIESLYLTHMLGFSGYIYSHKAYNGENLGKNTKLFDRISAVNLSKEIFEKYFDGHVSDNSFRRKQGISQQEVAQKLFVFFKMRANEYLSDNAFVESGGLK